MLSLAPAGFEESDREGRLELAAYVDEEGERRIRDAFGSVEVIEVAPGWADAWRAFHRPVRIGPLWVGPPWEPAEPGTIPVVIDPGRAFGTGAHATTRLCLELLLEERRDTVVDVGCGSGVLGIAAAKLGFGPVVALDRDPAAVEAARANARANGVALDVRLADALADPLPAASLVVANLELALVAPLASRIAAGRLIVSGYLAAERPPLSGWRARSRREASGWAAELFEREERPERSGTIRGR